MAGPTGQGALRGKDRINDKWYADGTELVDTDEGKGRTGDRCWTWCSRRIVGFAIGEHHDADRPAGRASTWL